VLTHLFVDICLGSFLKSLHGGSVVLHTLLNEGFSDVSLDECRIDLDGCFGIFECFRESK